MSSGEVTILDHLTALIAANDAKFREALRDRDDQLTQHFQSLKEGITTAMVAADKAVAKAEVATDKRFEGLNEWHASVIKQVEALSIKITGIEGEKSGKVGSIYLIGMLASLVVTVVSLVFAFSKALGG